MDGDDGVKAAVTEKAKKAAAAAEQAEEIKDRTNPNDGLIYNDDGTKTDPETGKVVEEESDDNGKVKKTDGITKEVK